jgi:hypothetical protein
LQLKIRVAVDRGRMPSTAGVVPLVLAPVISPVRSLILLPLTVRTQMATAVVRVTIKSANRIPAADGPAVGNLLKGKGATGTSDPFVVIRLADQEVRATPHHATPHHATPHQRTAPQRIAPMAHATPPRHTTRRPSPPPRAITALPQTKTSTKNETLEPEWDESFDFKGLMRDFLYSPTHGIEFELFDEDKLTENDSIGAPPPHPNPIALTLSPSP